MKTVASFILVIIFIPLFLIGIIAATSKFSLLNPVFWQRTFDTHNVYSDLAVNLKIMAEDKTVRDGGSRVDAKVLTDLITPLNLKDFIDRNLSNLLTFAGGQSQELFVYIPYKIIAKDLLPKSISNNPEEMTIENFLAKFNFTQINASQIRNISRVGIGLTYVLVLDGALLVLSLILLVLLAGSGKRLIGPATAFILSGSFTILLAEVVMNLKNVRQEVISIIASSLALELSKAWLFAGISFVLLGIVLLFLRKP